MQGTNTTHIVQKNLRKDHETLMKKEGGETKKEDIYSSDFLGGQLQPSENLKN